MAWRISNDVRNNIIYHHAGSMNGARSFLMLSPSDSVVVAVMSNNKNLDFIETFACGVRDAVIYPELAFPTAIEFEENCKISLIKNEKYYTATINFPSLFKTPKTINLIANRNENKIVLRNLIVEKDVLYMELSEENLLIYVKNEEGKWVKKEFKPL